MTAEVINPSVQASSGNETIFGVTLARFDRLAQRAGDWLNPILVKEARQALKSRQFMLTFSLLLIAAWGWTVLAIILLMPGIYYRPSGTSLLWGYYLVLAVPMLLVVPLAAHRSLASEVDDGTLDLLSVTNLSPIQIITGKLSSAALQIMLYFVTLFPCVAFSYLLRGIDLSTIIALLGLTFGVTAMLTVAGLFFASLAAGRSAQLGMMVLMLIIVVLSQIGFANLAYAIITYGVTASMSEFVAGAVCYSAFVLTVCYILMRAAAAQLSPPSENRSTPIRIGMLAHQLAIYGIISYPLLAYGNSEEPIQMVVAYAGVFWLIMGTLMVGESEVLTPRVRRDLPSSFLGRAVFTWLTPGPGTGLVLAVSSFVGFSIALYITMIIVDENRNTAIAVSAEYGELVLTIAGYLMLLLTITRWLMALIYRWQNTHPAVALAVLVIIAGLFAVAPYGIEVHLNDYARIDWSFWQITNWVWTLGLLLDGTLDSFAPYLIFSIGGIVWFGSLLTLGRVLLPMRLATPERVLAEKRLLLGERQADIQPEDPLGLATEA